jgi:ketopantoate hydroxymethyltransferase
VRVYAGLAEILRQALVAYRTDITEGRFPGDQESYHWPAAVREQFEKEMPRPA